MTTYTGIGVDTAAFMFGVTVKLYDDIVDNNMPIRQNLMIINSLRVAIVCLYAFMIIQNNIMHFIAGFTSVVWLLTDTVAKAYGEEEIKNLDDPFFLVMDLVVLSIFVIFCAYDIERIRALLSTDLVMLLICFVGLNSIECIRHKYEFGYEKAVSRGILLLVLVFLIGGTYIYNDRFAFARPILLIATGYTITWFLMHKEDVRRTYSR
jgi:cytochrome b subunit of formate dehydrogenase